MMNKNLYINLYKDSNEERNKELLQCLELNKRVFNKIYVLSDVEYKGVVNIPFVGIPTIKDLLNVADQYSSDDDINVISNSDIYFKELKFNITKERVFALTRWEGRAFFGYDASQDAWIFKGKLDNVENINFRLGLRGSDNAFAQRLEKAGYKVTNPSFDIKAYHLHSSKVRNYINQFAPQPYNLSVKPTTLAGNNIILATSINPFDRIKEQARAIRTWGDIIISVNSRKEIDLLSKMPEFKHVVFIETEELRLSKYVKLDAILTTLKRIEANRYVIINSDIQIRDYNKFIRELVSPDFILGVRQDVKGQNKREVFPFGYDVFCMNRRQLEIVCNTKTEYALGLPFWDFYIPLSMSNQNEKIRVNKDLFLHEYHETRYDDKIWRNMGDYSKQVPVFHKRSLGVEEFTTYNKEKIEKYTG